MEKTTLYGLIGVVLLAVIVISTGDFTANVARSGTPNVKQPELTVLTPTVAAGSNLAVKARNVRANQELQLFYPDGTYSGVNYEAFDKGECNFAAPGYYNCDLSLNIPHSLLPNGDYYIQTKSESSGKRIGTKAFLTITNSQYQETGR